jgi:succinate dehydrogenase/fumarate reductase cytochrome b subunit
MSDPDSARPTGAAGAASRRPDAAHRLLSWSGVFPLGTFLLIHVAATAAAARGDDEFASVARALRSPPAVALAWVAVLVPLAVHGAVGLWVVATRGRPLGFAPYPAPVRVAVRATGALGFIFIAVHLVELRTIPLGLPFGPRLGDGELASILVADLSSVWSGVPWCGAMYLVGAACVVFHFAAGLWGFFATTRAGQGVAARRRAAWGAGALGAAVWALFAHAVVFYATGSRLFGAGAAAEPTGAPCPDRLDGQDASK